MSKSASVKLLFLISVFTENAKDWIDVFSSPLPRISGYPKRDKTIKKAIGELLSQNRLEYKKEKELILIRPTGKAYKELASTFPFYRTFSGGWDGKFRFVIYDIPENKRKTRDAIRRILQLMHMGLLQSSVWVSPYDIEEELTGKLKKTGQENSVQIFEAKLALGKNNDFVNKIWDLNRLNNSYKELSLLLEKTGTATKNRRTRVEVFRRTFLIYQKLLARDPGLPSQLLPKNWQGVKVRTMLKKLQKLL